jgi:predicted DNA-binding protein (MmcQ/YjbR family)
MDIISFREYCISKAGVTEEFPFDNNTLVFKVRGKMFALTDVDLFESINLKCDPEEAILLREHYDAVHPGYHMHKKHWNTVEVNRDVPDPIIFEMIEKSYALVVATLPKNIRDGIV